MPSYRKRGFILVVLAAVLLTLAIGIGWWLGSVWGPAIFPN